MNKNQYKKTGSDESYTYHSLVKIILPFIEEFMKKKGIKNKKDLTIWCPFDLKEDIVYNGIQMFRSNYVDIFEKEGYNIIATHIATGQDFFKYEPEEKWDLIISNPPFSGKRKIMERALSFNKPFALISTAIWFNDSGINKVFGKVQERFSIIVPNRRAKFFKHNQEAIGNQPSFKSIYYCYKFTDKGVYFVEMEKE